MSRSSSPTALLALPSLASRSALRAGLMALRVLPEALPSDRVACADMVSHLSDQPNSVAFLDITNAGGPAPLTLLDLDAALPRDESRQRVFLTRLAGGHVSEADRRWVRSLGFADLLPEFDARDCEGGLRTALDAVAHLLNLKPLAPVELSRYARVLNEERDVETPRATLRSLTGKSAEDVADLLHRSLEIQDRSYRLQVYPSCFTGSEATSWMARRWHRASSEAVAIGQALGDLGLLFHVAQEHPFLDQRLFYRIARSDAADGVDLGIALERLLRADGVPVTSRSYLGTAYHECWVGAEAVDNLCQTFDIQRQDAWLVLYRLAQFGLIEHVTRARPMLDGAFFYRFKDVSAERSTT